MARFSTADVISKLIAPALIAHFQAKKDKDQDSREAPVVTWTATGTGCTVVATLKSAGVYELVVTCSSTAATTGAEFSYTHATGQYLVPVISNVGAALDTNVKAASVTTTGGTFAIESPANSAVYTYIARTR